MALVADAFNVADGAALEQTLIKIIARIIASCTRYTAASSISSTYSEELNLGSKTAGICVFSKSRYNL